jgi:hypothetical protein
MKIISEILDSRIHNIEYEVKSGVYTYTFTLKENTSYNPNDFPIVYTVWFRSPKLATISPQIHGEGPKAKFMISTLQFKNNVTSMSMLKNSNVKEVKSTIVFGTVAGIMLDYLEKNDKAQGITFVPAHSKLKKIYDLLSRKAEASNKLVWWSKQWSPPYYLIRKDIYENYLSILQQRGE